MIASSQMTLRLEKTLAERYGRSNCVVFSRGAAALYCLFSYLATSRGSSVIMPSLLCMSPALAATYAGLDILFADARPCDFQVDPLDIDELLKSHQDVAAVLVPHLYGSRAEIQTIVASAHARGVVVIEDAAQAQGLTIGGQPAGSFGDISLLSFGHTKIIDAGGGAALLFDDPAYETPLRELAAGLPPLSRRARALGEDYRTAYYALAPLFRRDPEMGSLYLGFPAAFRDLYLYGDVADETLGRVLSGLNQLDGAVARRREIAKLYRSELNHPRIHHAPYHEGDVPWRYSFTVDISSQSALADAVRSDGIDVSNWYPPLHRMLQPGSRSLKIADDVGQRIFNLWTEPDMDEYAVLHAAESVMRRVAEYDG